MHNPNIFALISLYFLCVGSFFISYKLATKMRTKNSFSIYQVSLAVNLFIILLGIYFLPHSLTLLFPFKTLYFFSFTLVGSFIFAYLFLKFEMFLCQIQGYINTIPLTFSTTILIIILIGLLEEMIFRGFTFIIVGLLNKVFFLPLTLFSVFAFGLSHLYFGWIQFFSKLIFSILMTIFYFLTGNLWLPFFCHGFFNYLVTQKYPQTVYTIAARLGKS